MRQCLVSTTKKSDYGQASLSFVWCLKSAHLRAIFQAFLYFTSARTFFFSIAGSHYPKKTNTPKGLQLKCFMEACLAKGAVSR